MKAFLPVGDFEAQTKIYALFRYYTILLTKNKNICNMKYK